MWTANASVFVFSIFCYVVCLLVGYYSEDYGRVFASATRSIARLLLSQRGWLSVTRRYCIEMDKKTSKYFLGLVAPPLRFLVAKF